MKAEPSFAEFEKDLSTRGDVVDFCLHIERRIEADLQGRSQWESKQELYYQQRYSQLNRELDFPFPGCSSIVIPTTDEVVDRVKAAEVGLFANVRPLGAFMPVGEGSIDLARKIEWYWDWRLRYSVPDFFQQLILGIDDRLQTGRCFLKNIYEYETQTVYQTVVLHDLPGSLRTFSVIPLGDKKAAAAAAEMIRKQSGGQATPITKEEFDKNEKRIKQTIVDEFALDMDEQMDRKACDQLMKFFRSGEKDTIIKKREVVKHYPRMIAVDPMDIIVPSHTKSLENADRITHRMWLTKDQLHKKVRDQRWSEKAVEDLIERGRANSGYGTIDGFTSYGSVKAMREGVQTYTEEDLYEIHENFVLYDTDGDGVGEKTVLTSAPGMETPLKFIAFPYDHNEWPIVDIQHELNDRSFYSPRGIPEKIHDLDAEITEQHRAKLNRMFIANAPTFTFRRGSGFNPSKVQWIPGQMYQVGQQGDVQAIQIPNLDISFDREQNILRAEIESYVGSPDLSITSPLGKPSQPRTAREINEISSISNQSAGYRTVLFTLGMQRVMNQLWALDQQYGPEELWVRVAEEEPFKLTRKQIQGKYIIVPRGSMVNSSPELEAQKIMMEVQALVPLLPYIMQDPEYEVKLPQRVLDYYQTLDPLGSRRFIRKRTPQEVQAIVAQQQQAQAVAQNTPVPIGSVAKELRRGESQAPNGPRQQVQL